MKCSSIGEAVGDGMRMINEAHGGAGEPAMRLFYDIAKEKKVPEETVAKFIAEKKRLPGFGHRLYKKDPRAELIMETITRLGFPKTYFTIAREIEKVLGTQLPEKTLPLNIDGAIAAALCTLGWKPETSTALFIIARSAGLCAHHLNTVQGSAG
jgi:citrate synthase